MERIEQALRAMGLSEGRIEEFMAMVRKVGRQKKQIVPGIPAVTRKAPKKTLRITYKGKGSTDLQSKAERTLSRMTKKRAVPPPVIVALEDAPATVPGPREDSPQWLKDAATAQRRFSRAGVYNRLASTLAALERSRIHKR